MVNISARFTTAAAAVIYLRKEEMGGRRLILFVTCYSKKRKMRKREPRIGSLGDPGRERLGKRGDGQD